MGQEIELKFTLPADRLRELARLPALKSWTRGRPVSQRLYSVYYDTPERALRAQGMALRLRRAGRRWVQTLKTAGSVSAGLHSRGEWETPAAPERFDFTAVPDAKLKEQLSEAAERAALRPVFATEFNRRSRILDWPNGDQIELSVDRGEIVAGEARAPICEVELEVKAGAPQRLFDLAAALLEALPLRLENASKAERGYLLASGVEPRPVKAKAPSLDASMSASAAFAAIVQGCVAHLQANEARVLDASDSEYVHQMRVALRRLRSAISLCMPILSRVQAEPIREELRWLSEELDGARNWDVFELETLAAIAPQFAGAPGFAWLEAETRARRGQANQRAREAVSHKRYQQLLLRVGAWLASGLRSAAEDTVLAMDPPVREFTDRVLKQRHKRLRKRGAGLAELGPEERHEVRIAAKKLRYAAEFFSSLYAHKQVRGYVDALTDLQAVLGAMNDAATSNALLDALESGDLSAEKRSALGVVRGWALGATQAYLRELDGVWRHFTAQRKFW